jgi:hypothetical protein
VLFCLKVAAGVADVLAVVRLVSMLENRFQLSGAGVCKLFSDHRAKVFSCGQQCEEGRCC